MTYIDEIARHIARQVDDPDPTPRDMVLYRGYALLALTVGEDVTRENVHDAWSAWEAETNPGHPHIVWFDDLSAEVQALDDEYVEAIRAVVRAIRAEGAA